ncbi:MAG TPA: PRC and DUF2382 domain-containing protein [Flavisolibacter sp.]
MAEQNKNSRLQRLSDSKYEIVDGEPNILDWDVKDSSGKRIGEVEDLLFDEQSRRVRYLVVDLDDNEFDVDDKEVLIPIGIAELHQNDDDVILPNITAEQLRALPEYDEDRFDEGYESTVRNIFAGAGGAALAAGATQNNDFYNHDHFNDDNLYRNRKQQSNDEVIPVIKEELEIGKREVETGAVRLRSRVVEEHVSEDINLRQERVNVDRTDVDRSATADDLRRAETEVEMREREEVPVVHKEARVVEEISLNKEVTERDEVIKDTVRNTEVDISRNDNNGDEEYRRDR